MEVLARPEQTPMGSRPSTTRRSTKSLPNGRMMGRSGRRLSPVCGILRSRSSSISACSMATGPTPWPKKGRWHWLLRPQARERGEGHRHDRQPWLLCWLPCPWHPSMRRTWSCCPEGLQRLEGGGQRGRLGPQRGLSSISTAALIPEPIARHLQCRYDPQHQREPPQPQVPQARAQAVVQRRHPCVDGYVSSEPLPGKTSSSGCCSDLNVSSNGTMA